MEGLRRIKMIHTTGGESQEAVEIAATKVAEATRMIAIGLTYTNRVRPVFNTWIGIYAAVGHTACLPELLTAI